MNIFNVFKKSDPPKTNDELVSTIGVTNFWSLDGKEYNPDKITLDTYDKIARNYQVKFSLAIIKYTIQQIDWFISCDNEEAKIVLQDSIETIWNRLILSISKSFKYGFSPSIKVFTTKEINGKIYYTYKKIRDLNPKDCTLKTDKYGNFDGFYYRDKDPKFKKYIKPMYAFWYVNDMENGNLYGESMLKTVYEPWWFSQKIHTFANRYYERFGEPLVIGRAPSNALVKGEDGKMHSAQETMVEAIEGIRSHSSAHIPSDRHPDTKEKLYDIEYLESQMRGFDFGSYLDRLDNEMSRGLFTPELMYAGGKGGSHSLGNVQTQAFYTNLTGIVDNITDYINLYLLPQLIAYNFSETIDAKFSYQPLTVNSVENLFNMIQELIKAGKIKPNMGQIERRSGFSFEEIDDTTVDTKIENSKAEIKDFIMNSEIKMKDKEIDVLTNAIKDFINE